MAEEISEEQLKLAKDILEMAETKSITNHNITAKEVALDYDTLWGSHGGQLEFVSQRIEWKPHTGDIQWCAWMTFRFTDHDQYMGGCEDAPVDKIFYEISVPICTENF